MGMDYKELEKRASYLTGLADGMNIESESSTGKLVKKLLEVVEDMALAINDLVAGHDELLDQVDEIDEDLAALETDYYGEDDDDDDCDCDCDDFEDELYQIDCPNCGETIYLDEDLLDDDELVCPNCREPIELEFDCDCDCDCDCEDGCDCDK